MLNFIAVGLCIVSACFCGFNGMVGWTIVDLVLVLFNLPHAIQWLMYR